MGTLLLDYTVHWIITHNYSHVASKGQFCVLDPASLTVRIMCPIVYVSSNIIPMIWLECISGPNVLVEMIDDIWVPHHWPLVPHAISLAQTHDLLSSKRLNIDSARPPCSFLIFNRNGFLGFYLYTCLWMKTTEPRSRHVPPWRSTWSIRRICRKRIPLMADVANTCPLEPTERTTMEATTTIRSEIAHYFITITVWSSTNMGSDSYLNFKKQCNKWTDTFSLWCCCCYHEYGRGKVVPVLT
jgi:hypothetical protein